MDPERAPESILRGNGSTIQHILTTHWHSIKNYTQNVKFAKLGKTYYLRGHIVTKPNQEMTKARAYTQLYNIRLIGDDVTPDSINAIFDKIYEKQQNGFHINCRLGFILQINFGILELNDSEANSNYKEYSLFPPKGILKIGNMTFSLAPLTKI